MSNTEMVLVTIKNTMDSNGKFNVMAVTNFCHENYDSQISDGQVTRYVFRLMNQGNDIRCGFGGNDFQLVATAVERRNA